MREVKVGVTGLVALVDDSDFDLVSQFSWRKVKDRCGVTYARREWRDGAVRKGQFMHNLIIGSIGIDHINHNGLDNRRENLRLATHSQNQGNQQIHGRGASRFRGVVWNKRKGKWQAQAKLGGSYKYLGLFDDEELAAKAVDTALLNHYGDFANLNFER